MEVVLNNNDLLIDKCDGGYNDLLIDKCDGG